MSEGEFDAATRESALRVFGHHELGHHQPLPSSPAIEVFEPGGQIQVQGTRFTPNDRVHIGFINGPDVSEAEFLADDNGEFFHVEECTNPASGGCLVIARNESTQELAFARTQRSFPCVPSDIDPGTNLEPG